MKNRICYLLPSREIGGTEKMASCLAKALSGKDFDVFVVTLHKRGNFNALLDKNGIRNYALDLKKNIFSGTVKLFVILSKEKPAIIHSFLFWGNLFGKFAGKILSIPVICSQRSTDDWKKPFHWWIEKITDRFCPVFISNSNSGKKVLVKKAGIRQDRIIVIPNGIAYAGNYESHPRPGIPSSGNVMTVGSIGNLRKAKGYRHFIKAAEIVSDRMGNINFFILGKGPERDNLNRLAESSGISDKVRFTGFVKNVYPYLADFDVLVIPSLWEGFPVVALEAMSMKKPVIATSVGDLPDIIDDGLTGLLVEPGNPEALAEAIMRVLRNPGERREMGENGYRKFMENYTLDTMVERYSNVYKGLVSNKTSGPERQ